MCNLGSTTAAFLGVLLALLPHVAARAQDDRQGQADAAFPCLEMTLAEYPGWLEQRVAHLRWARHDDEIQLNRNTLLRSFQLGRQYLIRNQKAAGNFNYQYDFIAR